ncbi:BrnA antitoxin family protein [uncultured Paracoccus sp.]|uniref:BrnA antitoxin family protein n=1 Tax=uncultured Paracoccus sp. TaxID=189685 RepID=UPI001D9CD520|nr:BrnA antitoxin family protein [uncultured Paracoccus sp.]MCB1466339.1 BrnA antitoxin family protein [Rhizobiaceae bacterium]
MTKFDPKHAAKYGYTRADWDDAENPEWTDEDFAKAKPFSEVFPDVAEKIRRGRPPLDNPKVAVSIRLDQDVVDAFKKDGPGWQSRVNAALREAAHLLP